MAWWLAAAAVSGGLALFNGMNERDAAKDANKQGRSSLRHSSSVRRRNTKSAGRESRSSTPGTSRRLRRCGIRTAKRKPSMSSGWAG